jgi:hypothetical protein
MEEEMLAASAGPADIEAAPPGEAALPPIPELKPLPASQPAARARTLPAAAAPARTRA